MPFLSLNRSACTAFAGLASRLLPSLAGPVQATMMRWHNFGIFDNVDWRYDWRSTILATDYPRKHIKILVPYVWLRSANGRRAQLLLASAQLVLYFFGGQFQLAEIKSFLANGCKQCTQLEYFGHSTGTLSLFVCMRAAFRHRQAFIQLARGPHENDRLVKVRLRTFIVFTPYVVLHNTFMVCKCTAPLRRGGGGSLPAMSKANSEINQTNGEM